MRWLYDIRYGTPEICCIQMAGSFVFQGQTWPAGSWYMIGLGGRRTIASDAQFLELDKTHGEAVVLQIFGVEGCDITGNRPERMRRAQRGYRARQTLARRHEREPQRQP